MGDAPRVSVIIPTRNRATLLPRAVGSVLAQTFENFELLIVDDCSGDDTQAVIAGFTDPRVRAFRHDANRRQSAAINTGIANARGEYAAFLDDDDELMRDSLADRVAVLDAAAPEVALAYGKIVYVDDATGTERRDHRPVLEDGEAFEYVLRATTLAPTSAILVRTAAAREVGGYDERLAAATDAFFMSTIGSKYRIAGLQKVAVRYHTNYGAPQISDRGGARRQRLAEYYQLHIQRFAAELEQRPKTLASVLRTRATNAMENGRTVNALGWSLAAFRAHPFNLGNLRHALRLARVFVFYATPLSRYRKRAKAAQRALRRRRG